MPVNEKNAGMSKNHHFFDLFKVFRRLCRWWNAAAECSTKQEILTWFLEACSDLPVKAIAQRLLNQISPETRLGNAILALA